jgi:hypothetical protein
MSDDPHVKGSWLRKLASVHAVPHRVFTIDTGRLSGVEFAVRWVPADAQAAAINEARKYLVEQCKWPAEDLYAGAGERAFEFESRVRLLTKALVVPSSPSTPAADSPDEVRRLFDRDEINRLYDEFDDFQAERSPWRHWKDAKQMEADLDAFEKGLMPATWLHSFDSASLRSIATSLADRSRTRMKDSSSATSSASDGGNDEMPPA